MSLLSLRKTLLQPEASLSFGVVKIDEGIKPAEPLVHFMNRTSFGLRESEMQRARSMTYAAYVNLQLAATGDNTALEAQLASIYPSLAMDGPTLIANYPVADNRDAIAAAELRAATTLRQLYSNNQLFEVMVEFWTNHFAVEHNMGFMRQAKTLDDRDLRKNALGKFRDLLNANARSPAMLYYLDNYVNTKLGVQENYGREIMELHTIGVDGGYTEDDVKAVARAFTGWGLSRGRLEFAFTQRNHDVDEKVVLGVRLAANRGMEDGQDVLNLLASHPSTARFISTKLIRRFVTDTPSEALIAQIQRVFTLSDGDIRQVLAAIFNSVDFMASGDLKYKRPQEFMLSLLRSCEATTTGATFLRALNGFTDAQGQTFSNWPGPDGYPDIASHWINTTAWLGRWNLSFAAIEGRLDRGIVIDAKALAGNASTPATLVDRLTERVLRRTLSLNDRDDLIALASAGKLADGTLVEPELGIRAREVLSVMLSSRYFNFR